MYAATAATAASGGLASAKLERMKLSRDPSMTPLGSKPSSIATQAKTWPGIIAPRKARLERDTARSRAVRTDGMGGGGSVVTALCGNVVAAVSSPPSLPETGAEKANGEDLPLASRHPTSFCGANSNLRHARPACGYSGSLSRRPALCVDHRPDEGRATIHLTREVGR